MANINEVWRADTWENAAAALLWISGSFVFWRIGQYLVKRYLFTKDPFGDTVRLRGKKGHNCECDGQLEISPKTQWRISNEGISLVHSLVSGLWAAYVILYYKERVAEEFFSSNASVYLMFMTAGYLLHDFLDMVMNEHTGRIAELLFHHFVVLTSFVTFVIYERWIGTIMLGLLMELNSVFLHVRSLCNLYRVDKNSTPFRIVALLNLVTFILFRHLVCVPLIYWQYTMWGVFKFYEWCITGFVIGSILLSNLVLFYRVLSADGFIGNGRGRSPAPVQEEDGSSEYVVSASDIV